MPCAEETWHTDPDFFEALGARPGCYIKPEEEGGDDVEAERSKETDAKLFRVSDASGHIEVQEVEERPLHRNMLDSNVRLSA